MNWILWPEYYIASCSSYARTQGISFSGIPLSWFLDAFSTEDSFDDSTLTSGYFSGRLDSFRKWPSRNTCYIIRDPGLLSSSSKLWSAMLDLALLLLLVAVSHYSEELQFLTRPHGKMTNHKETIHQSDHHHHTHHHKRRTRYHPFFVMAVPNRNIVTQTEVPPMPLTVQTISDNTTSFSTGYSSWNQWRADRKRSSTCLMEEDHVDPQAEEHRKLEGVPIHIATMRTALPPSSYNTSKTSSKSKKWRFRMTLSKIYRSLRTSTTRPSRKPMNDISEMEHTEATSVADDLMSESERAFYFY